MRTAKASPKGRCRGVVSLSWDARGRAPLKKQGGQARRARNAERKLLKNKNKIKAEADLLEVAEPIATNRRRESAAHLGACASNKDAFVCMRIARACADRSRGWAEAARRTSRRRQPPLREQVYMKLLFNNMITAQWTSDVIEGKESKGRRVWPKERVSVLSCLRGCWVLSGTVARGRATI